MIDADGLLKISSSSVYDKLQYKLSGSQAVVIDNVAREDDDAEEAAMVQIKLDPRLQLEGAMAVVFRLPKKEDRDAWISVLSG
jgi:hypothetical protein